MLIRTDIVNSIVERIDAKSYLEIGVGGMDCFNAIKCDKKVGVDPCGDDVPTCNPTLNITSDEFFSMNEDTFDVIFIDGLHISEQVEKDIINALEILNDGGYIICHDMHPPEESWQIVPPVQANWNGDCWKAWVRIRTSRDDLIMFTVNTDFGCGVITKGKQETINIDDIELNWKNFEKYKSVWMNFISPFEFEHWILHG